MVSSFNIRENFEEAANCFERVWTYRWQRRVCPPVSLSRVSVRDAKHWMVNSCVLASSLVRAFTFCSSCRYFNKVKREKLLASVMRGTREEMNIPFVWKAQTEVSHRPKPKIPRMNRLQTAPARVKSSVEKIPDPRTNKSSNPGTQWGLERKS